MTTKCLVLCSFLVCAGAMRTDSARAEERELILTAGSPSYCLDEWHVCVHPRRNGPLESDSHLGTFLPERDPEDCRQFIAGDRIVVDVGWLCRGHDFKTCYEFSPVEKPAWYYDLHGVPAQKRPIPGVAAARAFPWDSVRVAIASGPSPDLSIETFRLYDRYANQQPSAYGAGAWVPHFAIFTEGAAPGLYRLHAEAPDEVLNQFGFDAKRGGDCFWLEPAGTPEAFKEARARRFNAAMRARQEGLDDPQDVIWKARALAALPAVLEAAPDAWSFAERGASVAQGLGELDRARELVAQAWASLARAAPEDHMTAIDIDGNPPPAQRIARLYQELHGYRPPDADAMIAAERSPASWEARDRKAETRHQKVCERQIRDFPGIREEAWYCDPRRYQRPKYEQWVSEQQQILRSDPGP
ncbi:MAG: hypothetical protein HYV63_00980 [Candidatus Schekmanbacteria bacterium]|nr:hypothetical protein [Candidatus Schekmanbacteria bacterium]